MSDHGDLDRDDDDESNIRSSRERRISPIDDSGSRSPSRSSSKRPHKSGAKDLSTIGKKVAEKSGGLFSPEDWMCKSCGNINWARRSTCNMCNMPKYQKAEARTGAGGGYNERDNVEYNERQQESDGEYDEFGRKKKKFRNITKDQDDSNQERIITKSKPSRSLAEDNEEDEDEDDDDEFDATKYALDSDDDNQKDNKNHQPASSSSSNKKSSSSHERRDSNSRSNSSSSDNHRSGSSSRDRHYRSLDDKKSSRYDKPSSSNNRKLSNSPRSSKRSDDYYERRRSRSRSPVSTSSRKQHRH